MTLHSLIMNVITSFFKLICDMVSYGVCKLFYKLPNCRNSNEFFSGNTLPNNCILIDCQVGFLFNKLFAEYPIFREVSRCSLCGEIESITNNQY